MKKKNKIKTYTDFENDVVLLKTDTEYIKVDEPMELVQITGLLTDEDEITKVKENFMPDTHLNVGEVKRGQILWLTCILRKPGSSYSQQQLGVVQCRVVDYFYGLNKLSTLKL